MKAIRVCNSEKMTLPRLIHLGNSVIGVGGVANSSRSGNVGGTAALRPGTTGKSAVAKMKSISDATEGVLDEAALTPGFDTMKREVHVPGDNAPLAIRAIAITRRAARGCDALAADTKFTGVWECFESKEFAQYIVHSADEGTQ